MEAFTYRNGRLYAEGVDLAVLAEAVGTPCYVYSRAMIEERYAAFDRALASHDHLVCYAVKANANLAVLDVLARRGSGFDIVSGGELERVLAAGGDPAKVVFSGVGKTAAELRRALEVGIYCFNVESEAELALLERIAKEADRPAPVALRVNPDVDPATHPYIATGLRTSKFGIPIERALELYRGACASPHLRLRGVACHIGSQLVTLDPLVEALERLVDIVGELADAGIELEHLDLGGGLGIRYRDEQPPEPDDYALALAGALQGRGSRYQRLRLVVEPGRAIVGNAGVLLTRVLYTKAGEGRDFAIVDAAMNDLLRPALYDAWHEIAPVVPDPTRPVHTYDVVGPVCESGDFLGRDRTLPALRAGDLLAVASAGAYGAVMSSNYNTRPRAPEVLVDGERYHIVRRRETVADLLALESRLPD
jgi:diaminopimelate decarboxylase